MKQEKFQLAVEYNNHIKILRQELDRIDDVTILELRSPNRMDYDQIPNIRRDLNEFPGMKAIIKATLEKELAEYEKKFEEL